jgi:hypothetical protein
MIRSRWFSCAVPAACAFFALSQGLAADTVTLEPIKDNTLIEDVTGELSNGLSDGVFCGRTGATSGLRILRAVLAFDVQGNIPAGSTINSVSLTLTVINSVSASQTHTLHRLLADWGEGASSSPGGGGAPAQTGDATWLHRFFPDAFWSTEGGDFVAGASASTSVAGASDAPTWSEPNMTADVQAWLDDPASNFGWMIRGNELGMNTAKKLASRHWRIPEQRPRLIVDFTPPSSCAADVNGSGAVTMDDLRLVINQWGQSGKPGANPSDINDDGDVDMDDLLEVLVNWGACD